MCQPIDYPIVLDLIEIVYMGPSGANFTDTE